jgi:hypothetical protein
MISSWNGTISNLDSNKDWNSISSRFKNHFLGIRTKFNTTGTVKLLNENLLIYPNPTKGKLYITNTTGNLINYTIYDLNGQIILIGKTQESIDVSTLSVGIYILKTNQGNFKFIKE